MANRRSARTLVRAPRRSMFWEGNGATVTLASGTVSATAMVTEATLESVPNPTLVRTRGDGIVYATAIGASGAQCQIEMGLIKITARALAAGVSSMPTPGTDVGSDWLWHRSVAIGVRGSLGADSESVGAHVARFEIDNKAMRKFEPNEALVVVFENTVITSTVTALISVHFWFLFKK